MPEPRSSTTPTSVAEVSDDERAGIQRRTLRTLMGGIVPGGAAMSGAYSSAAILGEELSGSEALGGVAASCMTMGAALTAIPLARFMTARGRRPGIAGGYGVAMGGAGLCFLAVLTGWYPLLAMGILCVGLGYSANMAARFAAADLADEPGTAIGTLIWASTFGSVLGPILGFGPARALATTIGLDELAGPYLFSIVMFGLAATIVGTRLRPDPLAVAGGLGRSEERVPIRAFVRPVLRSRDGMLAVGSMMTGHVVMVGVMTMMPLHLRSGGNELPVVGYVISLHIIGMYALSPIVGRLADRIGARPMIAVGGVLLALGAEVAAHNEAHESLGAFVGMFLIGVGWSCGLVASSALIVRTFTGDDRVGIQGLTDLCMTGAGASAGMLAGLTMAATGFHRLSHAAVVVGLVPPLVVVVAWLGRRRATASSRV